MIDLHQQISKDIEANRPYYPFLINASDSSLRTPLPIQLVPDNEIVGSNVAGIIDPKAECPATHTVLSEWEYIV